MEKELSNSSLLLYDGKATMLITKGISMVIRDQGRDKKDLKGQTLVATLSCVLEVISSSNPVNLHSLCIFEADLSAVHQSIEIDKKLLFPLSEQV